MNEGMVTKERFAQSVKAGLPVNPVGGEEIKGANLTRLAAAMLSNRWTDLRFISESDAERNGWSVRPGAHGVQITVGGLKEGKLETMTLFNAGHVSGIPSMEKMLAMTDTELAAMQGRDAPGMALGAGEVRIGPVRQQVKNVGHEGQGMRGGAARETVDAVLLGAGGGGAAGIGGGAGHQAGRESRSEEVDARHGRFLDWAADNYSLVVYGHVLDVYAQSGEFPEEFLEFEAAEFSAGRDQRFAVMAPYWLDGLHNAEGIALAAELNQIVQTHGLTMDAAAIERLLKERDRAFMLELEVVPEERRLRDDLARRNPAEPETLLGGELVRDKLGAYRPKAGGRAVIEDRGDSLVVKGKTAESYEAAIELAVAKGWTAIELSGKGPMLASAWLEAKMQGLEVVNYSPSKEDEKRLVERMGQEAARKAALAGQSTEQTAEMVEVRPFIDSEGQAKTATISYRVTREGSPDISFDNAKDAAACFVEADASCKPAVIRSVIRAGDEVNEEVMVAGTDLGVGGELSKSADIALDREFSEAVSEVLGVVEPVALGAEPVSQGDRKMFSGLILKIEGNFALQKVGRDPSDIERHDIRLLSRMPVVGEVEEIAFGRDGRGMVKERAGRELGIG